MTFSGHKMHKENKPNLVYVTATTYFYSNLIINTKLENKVTGVRNLPSRFIALIFC